MPRPQNSPLMSTLCYSPRQTKRGQLRVLWALTQLPAVVAEDKIGDLCEREVGVAHTGLVLGPRLRGM